MGADELHPPCVDVFAEGREADGLDDDFRLMSRLPGVPSCHVPRRGRADPSLGASAKLLLTRSRSKPCR
jgi:hypothetical protein